jgi:flagellar biosynthesis/type III secretory pathway chaperone
MGRQTVVGTSIVVIRWLSTPKESLFGVVDYTIQRRVKAPTTAIEIKKDHRSC